MDAIDFVHASWSFHLVLSNISKMPKATVLQTFLEINLISTKWTGTDRLSEIKNILYALRTVAAAAAADVVVVVE